MDTYRTLCVHVMYVLMQTTVLGMLCCSGWLSSLICLKTHTTVRPTAFYKLVYLPMSNFFHILPFKGIRIISWDTFKSSSSLILCLIIWLNSMQNYFAEEFITATYKSVSVLPCPGLCLVTLIQLQIFCDLTYTKGFIVVKNCPPFKLYSHI